MDKPINITLLRPDKDHFKSSKSFYKENGKIKAVKVSSKDFPTHYTHRTVQVKDIQQFYALLQKCADKKFIRIAGEINLDGAAELLTTGNCKRQNAFFDDAGTRVLCFDADDWQLADNMSLATPKQIGETVRTLLITDLGFKFLTGCQFIVLLSSSYFDGRVLNGHIYFILDEPVSVVVLREWYNVLLSKEPKPKHKLDPALFRQVQPDYISKRLCIGFHDPLPDDLRLTLHCDSLQPCVTKAGLLKHIEKDIEQYGTPAVQGADFLTTGSSKAYKEESWEKTLSHCGGTWGINEVMLTAASQLLASQGKREVENNLAFYMGKFRDLAGSAMATHGTRNTAKDRTRYLVESKIKNYLDTAIGKQYGNRVDEKRNTVDAAITEVIRGGTPSLLFQPDVLQAARFMQKNQPGKYIDIADRIKKELRGRIQAFEKAVKDTDKVDKPDTAQLLNALVTNNDWIRAKNTGMLYLKIGNKDGYSMLTPMNGMHDVLYSQLLELTGSPMTGLEKQVYSFVRGLSHQPMLDPIVEAEVYTRCHTRIENDKYVCYYNCGTNELGFQSTVVIKEDSIEVIPSAEAPVSWNTEREAPAASVVDLEEFRAIYGDDTEDELIQDYINGMRRFSSAEDDESLIDLLAWQVVVSLDVGMSPILQLVGSSSSGKSVTATFVKDLVDPTSPDMRSAPDLQVSIPDKDNMALQLLGKHVTVYDNLANIKPQQQNLLCTIATGSTHSIRTFFTQDYMKLAVRKPIIITSLIPIITQQDLRSRAVTVHISRDKRALTGDIISQWERNRSGLRTGMLLVGQEVLRRVGIKRRSDVNFNMNDRQMWATETKIALTRLMGLAATEAEAEQMTRLRVEDFDTSEALKNSRASQLIVWLLNDDKLKGQKEYRVTSSKLYYMFKEWNTDNQTAEFEVRGETIEVSMKNRPDGVKHFAVQLGIHWPDIELVTGWEKQSCSIKRTRATLLHRRVALKKPEE